ncbi:unnamed protein product [Strongylus vulgaris]|uniref:SANT domain-containing protein n=1 Tax=Strongylus vulgaris TaxID=40348 RepID=A0A3P7IZQ8_STRVU|nr:unnamed protein product [Strongylus vulgaris]
MKYCRDQIEEWSAAEANLFEDALEKYGKDFSDVRVDFLPWKSPRDIVEYYYMWKTTNRYVEQKKKKNAEHESKLKQVYIPNHSKTAGTAVKGTEPCEGCKITESSAWHAWGPTNLQLRLCQDCWWYWKKYGGLKERHQHVLFQRLRPLVNFLFSPYVFDQNMLRSKRCTPLLFNCVAFARENSIISLYNRLVKKVLTAIGSILLNLAVDPSCSIS